jgi:hypothetical protein
MSGSKRPSTSSLRRFITSRPYVTVAELRRRFALDDPDGMAHMQRNGTSAWIGLPEREASKLQDLWERDEVGVELSVEVRAPVVVGIYPMRIARYVLEGGAPNGNGAANGNGATSGNGPTNGNGAANGNGHHPEPADRRSHPGSGPGSGPGRGHLPRYPSYRPRPSGYKPATGE